MFFLGLSIILLLCLAWFQPPQSFNWRYINPNSDNRSEWLYKQFQKTDTLDFLFLGSSQTMGAIDDSVLGEKLNKKVLNMGMSRYGRNMDYLILLHFLQKHQLKNVVIETRYWENTFSHPNAAYVETFTQLLESGLHFNRDFFRDFGFRLNRNAYYFRNFGVLKSVEMKDNYGFWLMQAQADKNVLTADSVKNYKRLQKEIKNPLRGLENSVPIFYQNKIEKLCKENNIKIYYLFLPGYGWQQSAPLEYDELKAKGSFLIPDEKIRNNADFYADGAHFNQKGADAMTLFLSQALATN